MAQGALSYEERCRLIKEVCDYVIDHTESFSEDYIGEDLAYLFAGIADGTRCEWDSDRPLVKLLRESRLAPVRAALDYIDVTDEGASQQGRTLLARLLRATRAFTGTADTRNDLINALNAYEATGDHNHGSGPIAAGASCPGGDCTVHVARGLLAGRITRSA